MAERTTASVAALLSADHHRLDAVLAEVKRSLGAGEIPRALERFSAFRGGLVRHIVVEEEVLFPALERLSGAVSAAPIQVMRAEHAELRRLMTEVEASLERPSSAGPVTPLAALTARIYAHNGKEERILYPLADRAIGGEEQRADVLRRMEDALREGTS